MMVSRIWWNSGNSSVVVAEPAECFKGALFVVGVVHAVEFNAVPKAAL